MEARWAVFFDALGVKYEYEPEGFELPNGERYLPDFRVKCYGTRGSNDDEPFDLYIEVKGKMTAKDYEKITVFARHKYMGRTVECCEEGIANPILIVGKIPSEGCATDSEDCGAYDEMDGFRIYPFNYELIDGDHFGAYPAATNDGKFYLMGDEGHYINLDDKERVEEAYSIARQARFEHGEKPNVR